jgi:hypothetical protein
LTNTLHYGFYLACSWLWCLGGFFPLILGRDYGWPALAAFTVFNVGGAMAMGFYFKQRLQQLNFERNHKPAIAIFSYVTIAYQLFFVAWLGTTVGQPFLLAGVVCIAFIIYHSKNVITYWALLFYLLSIGLFISFLGSDWQSFDISAKSYFPHVLLPLAIGFIFSPYLDITFHRAYKSSDNPRLSFAIGFGVLFLSLVGFVFYYAGSLGDVFFNQAVPGAILYPVIGFLVLQTAFTIAAHSSELTTQQYLNPSLLVGTIGLFSLIAVGVLTLVKGAPIPWGDVPLEEIIYKFFLFFYSLVFPLYLLLGTSKPTYLWVLGICTPAYAIGFLLGGAHSYSLTIGVVIILAVVIFKRQVSVRQST